MMKKILLQLDGDPLASSFDSIVAYDSQVDSLLTYPNITPENVTPIVHGAIFTRGGDALRHTAIFVGGSDVKRAEAIMKQIQDSFFGNMRVSVMLDANGCNTTAAAAVVSAGRHVSLAGSHAVVMGATGPVGERVARLLVGEGADVTLTSRSAERAEAVCQQIRSGSASDGTGLGTLRAAALKSPQDAPDVLGDASILVACGAAGVQFVSEETLLAGTSLQVAIDLNAVPPAGIAGIEVTNKATQVGQVTTYGAIGVGGLKMKTHRRAVESLFESNRQVLDHQAIYELAKKIEG